MRHEVIPLTDQTATTADDATGWIEVSKFENKTVTVHGTFVGTAQVQGKVVKTTPAIDTGPLNVGAALTAPGAVDVSSSFTHVRVKVTAYTSGTIKGVFTGFNSRSV